MSFGSMVLVSGNEVVGQGWGWEEEGGIGRLGDWERVK
jgi:hypothetical protein